MTRGRLCAAPSFVRLICEPDLDVELVTITPMYAGSGPAGGGALLPGSVDEPLAVTFRAKPLNALGEAPPLSTFIDDDCELQNVREPVAVRLPMPKAPPPGANAYTSTCVVAEAVLPPSSVIVVVTVYGPVAV